MKDNIKFYYNLDGEVIEQTKKYCLFFSNDIYYIYIKCDRDVNEIKDILKICDELQRKNITVGNMIMSINNEFINNGYVLIKLNSFLDDTLEIKDIINYNNKLVLNDKYFNNWGKLWESKIDYLEYQIRELGKNKKTVISSFSYYIGLAENSLLYLNKVNSLYPANSTMVLSRLRVTYPAFENDYFNPLNFIFDSRIRDIAEYLKSKFFAGFDIWTDIEYVFREKYTVYEYNIFYARMLYPSYYFDVFEEVILNDVSETRLQLITNKTEEYEMLLKELYYYLSKYTNIIEIDWIIKGVIN